MAAGKVKMRCQAAQLLARGCVSDDSEGSSAAPQLFADPKISATAVMSQDSEYRIGQSWDQKLKSRSAYKSKQPRVPKCQVCTGRSQASHRKIIRWMLGMGFLLLASVSFRPWEGPGGIKNFKPLFEPSAVDQE